MKRYKLKRDLPTFKAGEIFHLSGMGNLIHESDGVVAYSWSTIGKFPNIMTDWFEEIKESTRWKPELGYKYYLSDSNGSIYDSVWSNDYIDRSRSGIGNCFQTEDEAKRVVEYLKALAVVRGDATSKFDKVGNNFCVFYDTTNNYLTMGVESCDMGNGIFGLPYFATVEDAQRSIKQHKNEWLTIFGVEEEECD